MHAADGLGSGGAVVVAVILAKTTVGLSVVF